MRILNERRAAAEGSYLLMKKTNKCMKMGLLAAALLAGVMMGCSNVSNSGSGDSSGSGNGGQTQKVDFDTWLLKVAFDKDNVPTYTFFKPDDGRKWELGTDGYTVNGKEGEVTSGAIGKPVSFTEVVWHQYRGDNPLYEDSAYNTMANQFYYYRFTGKMPFIKTETKQYLIAVDKASSFIFAFAKVVSSQPVAGQEVPTEYEAIEKSTGGSFFYMNDPIGYVNADGSVLLYDEYTSEMKEKGIDYVPSIHNPDRAEATATAAGRSPYYTK